MQDASALLPAVLEHLEMLFALSRPTLSSQHILARHPCVRRHEARGKLVQLQGVHSPPYLLESSAGYSSLLVAANLALMLVPVPAKSGEPRLTHE
jgi:hypothetical protein